MPNRNGTGPRGFGPETGRGMGPCCGERAYRTGRGYGQGPGYRRGFSRGRGFGWGPGTGMGWAAVGYGQYGAAPMRAALESRRDFLRTELARTDALLAEEGPNTNPQGAGKDTE
jgi:hypothetical protein